MTAPETDTSTIEYRLSVLEKQADLSSRLTALEKQAAELGAYLKAAAIIAAVFGLSGAWGLKTLSEARDQISSTRDQISSVKQQGAVAQRQIGELKTRADSLANGLAKTSEGVASLGSTESLTRRVEAVVQRVASPNIITNRVNDALAIHAPRAVSGLLPQPVTVRINNTTCGTYRPQAVRCFVNTGSLQPALGTVANVGGFPSSATVACEPGRLRNMSGVFVTVYFNIPLGLGDNFAVSIFQPGRRHAAPAVLRPS